MIQLCHSLVWFKFLRHLMPMTFLGIIWFVCICGCQLASFLRIFSMGFDLSSVRFDLVFLHQRCSVYITVFVCESRTLNFLFLRFVDTYRGMCTNLMKQIEHVNM